MIPKNCPRLTIGEGPVWNEREGLLYFVDSPNRKIYTYDPEEDSFAVRGELQAFAVAFDGCGHLLVSTAEGVLRENENGSFEPLCERAAAIRHANDMKVGPDGRLYIGTQSGRRVGISDEIDGRLYVVDPCGEVRVLLDGLRLSNGMDWSVDGKLFYHTDSDTHMLREYAFDARRGDITFTGRELSVPGIDGFAMDRENILYAACWGRGYIAKIDTAKMCLLEHIVLPFAIPTSCAFCGEERAVLAVTSASLGADAHDRMAGRLLLLSMAVRGKQTWLFGEPRG